jgi:glyoxylase-like metal-dependent hydrolase (beta-lactamase superfamily II)
LRVQQVRPNLHVLSSTAGNVAVWSGPDGVVLVDDGLAATSPQLLEAIGRISRGPIRFVVDTHWHPDHSGGNEALARAGAVVIAHDSVRERLGQPQVVEEYDSRFPAAPAAALPLVTFATSAALHLNGDRLGMVHVADAHSGGDVIVRWDSANAVHLGDLFYNGGYPFIDLADGGSLAGMVAAIEATLARTDAQTVVIPGHGPVATRAELAAYRDMLVAVGKRVRSAVEQGASLEEVQAAHPTAEYDERYGKGGTSAERFVRTVYRDLTDARPTR